MNACTENSSHVQSSHSDVFLHYSTEDIVKTLGMESQLPSDSKQNEADETNINIIKNSLKASRLFKVNKVSNFNTKMRM